MEYVQEFGHQRVTYRSRHCDVEAVFVEVDGEEYGLLKGAFVGEVCQLSALRVEGTPERLFIGGAFAGTLDE